MVVLGFAGLIAAGTVALALPVATQSGAATRPLDAFFTAVSAVCVTGLVVVDTADHWSPFGQLVILALIQVGGFGFMTSSTLLLLLLAGRGTSLRDRVLVQASLGAPGLGGALPLLRRIAVFTLTAEGLGAVLLAGAFASAGIAPATSAWWGVFFSISAFNHAGFDLTGGFASVIPFAGSLPVLGVLGALIVFGSLGYAIVADVLAKRRWRRFALETKVVLVASAGLLVAGAVAFGLIEWANARTLGDLPTGQRVSQAIFTSISARSGGFASVDVAALRDATLFTLMALMFIGGASGSTAGGIKVNTFAVLGIAIASALRGRVSAEAFGRRIRHETVYAALAIALLSLAFVYAASLVLSVSESTTFIAAAFEIVSAFGTVGLSAGLTPELTDAGRLVVALTMFVGRLGPLVLVLAFAERRQRVAYRPGVESIRIG